MPVESMETLKRRMDNMGDLLAIVKTMKTLAAVNIRQYEHAVEALTDYNRTVELGLRALLHQMDTLPAAEPTPAAPTTGIILFGSDQGMCGQFNDQVVNFALAELDRLQLAHTQRILLAIGARAVAALQEHDHPVQVQWAVPGSIEAITPLIHDIVTLIDGWRSQQAMTRVLLFFNRPVSNSAYRPELLTLWPVDWSRLQRLAHEAWPTRLIPMFTMSVDRLLAALLRQYLFVSLYRAFAESLMSENASRMVTMQAAETNIQEHLEDLTMLYHQQRQTAITAELLDIVAGFEALTGAASAQRKAASSVVGSV
jgi:F-type H+-transporting ATPase subunit gamma